MSLTKNIVVIFRVIYSEYQLMVLYNKTTGP